MREGYSLFEKISLLYEILKSPILFYDKIRMLKDIRKYMRMLVMIGYEATRRIKATVEGQAIPIIAVTATARGRGPSGSAASLRVWPFSMSSPMSVSAQ